MQPRNLIVIRYSTLLCFIFFVSAAHAQVNYVLNPSFEQYTKCPFNLDQIKFANYWQPIDTTNHPPVDSFGNPNCTPEYCNTCAGSNNFAGVPYNGKFYHYPHIGNGMAQVLMFYDEIIPDPYRRDYLQGKLYKSLIAGKSYCVTFFVTLEQASTYAINHIGAYLDNGIIDTTQNCGSPQITHVPQVQTLNIITDTLHWVKIEGSFVATGNEKYITIGNFYDKTHTTYIPSISVGNGAGITWYLVDDVSVVESNTPAYAGGTWYKAKKDSVFIGRNEIVPDCYWYRNGLLIDTVHAGFWVKDTVATTYVVKQSICGNVKYDTAHIFIAHDGVGSVGNESVYRIYPNPATTELTIQAPNNTSTAAMNIYDMNGRMVLQSEVDFVNGQSHVPLSLKPGLYVLQIVDERGGRNVQRLSVL